MPQSEKHILVIRLSAMGDVAMTVPVLRAVTEHYPELKITVLTREFFKPFFRDLTNVEIFCADVKGDHKGVFGLYKLSKQLKAIDLDAVADLHNVLRSKILKFFLFGKHVVQIDKGRKEKLKRQAVFYKILLQNSFGGKYNFHTATFDFLERNDTSGEYERMSFEINQSDVDEVIAEINQLANDVFDGTLLQKDFYGDTTNAELLEFLEVLRGPRTKEQLSLL